MAARRPPPTLPKPVIFGALALMAVTLVWAASEGWRTEVPGAVGVTAPTAEVVAERQLRFLDRADGGVAIIDAATDRPIAVVPSGEGSFLRGVLRSLAHDRQRRELSTDAAFRLAQRDDGQIAIEDPLTGAVIDLRAFGVDNVAAFARYLPASGEPS